MQKKEKEKRKKKSPDSEMQALASGSWPENTKSEDIGGVYSFWLMCHKYTNSCYRAQQVLPGI